MSEPKKVDRRKFIYAGLGAVALIAIGAAAYVAMNPPVVTQTTTVPTTSVATTTSVTTTTVPTTSVVTTTVPTTSVMTTTVMGPTKVNIVTYHGGFWGVYGTEEQRFDFNAILHKKYPNIDVSVLHLDTSIFTGTLNSMFASGAPPDVFMMWGGKKLQPYVEKDQCTDLTPLYERYGWLNLIPKYMVDEYRNIAGKPGIWGICEVYRWEHETYNADIFEKYNVKPPKTYKEWVDMCETLVANKVSPYVGYGSAYGQERLFSRAVEKCFNDKGETYGWDKLTATRGYKREIPFTDDAVIKALYMLKEWWNKKYIHPGFFGFGWDDEQKAMFNAEAAIIIEGIWEPGYLEVNKFPYKYGTFFFPSNDDPSRVRWETYAEGYSVVKGANLEAVGKVFDVWLSDEVQTLVAQKSKEFVLPNPKALDPNLIPKAVWDMKLVLDKGQPTRQVCHTAFTEEFTVVLRTYVAGVMQGKISPEKAAEALENEATKQMGPIK